MKKTKWIVENFTHESSYVDLVDAIKKEGHELKEIKGDFKYSDLDGYNWESPVLFLGSINMTNTAFERMPHCYPVAYCNQQNYLCTRYMSHYGKYLFNDKYAIVSLKEFHRHKFFYYGIFGNESLIFIRPDSGQKPFQAQLIDLIDIDRFLEINKNIEHELVVISCPKNIRGEFRFVVSSKKEIISHSTYRFQDQVCKIPAVPVGATKLVKEILEVGYYPDSVFVMDVCEDHDNNYWLMELNSFSSAGLYACNKTDIVKKVSEIAEEEWKEWYSKYYMCIE
jgi:hypothetical protein